MNEYRVQKTTQEFSIDASTKWHVIDETGAVVRYFFTKREADAWARARQQQRTSAFQVFVERTSGDEYASDQRWIFMIFEDDCHVITGYARTKALALSAAKLDIADAIAEREHAQQELRANQRRGAKKLGARARLNARRVEAETGSWPQRKSSGQRVSHEQQVERELLATWAPDEITDEMREEMSRLLRG
jgi:hypothetical protein